MHSNTQDLFALELSEASKTYLAETAKWTRFLSVIGFVISGLLIVLGIFMSTIISSSFAPTLGSSGGLIFSIVYIALAVLYFFPCFYLLKFSAGIRKGLQTGDNIQLEAGLKNLKSCFRFMGILTIIVLSFYGLAVAGGLAAGLFTR